ncbi:MAG TPA: ABC-2 family transporter protein [Chthonomonadaceae bacterium]|nr:ABC-2 family transporter protein [Chthonomonadaceae bacterium]
MTLLLRRYGKTAAMAVAGFVGDSPMFLMDYLLRFLRVAVMLSIWRTILAGRGPVSGMTLSAVLTYTLIAEVFAEQLTCRTELVWAFWDGSIATRFLKPMGVFAQFTAEMLGRWAFGFCLFSLPLLLCASLLGVNPLPASGAAGLLFLASLALGVSVGLTLEYISAGLAVGLEMYPYVLSQARAALATVLSGAFLPLALLPWGLGKVFGWLPFASMASAPLRIYTGTGDPLWLLAVQAGWSALLWPVAAWLWRVNRERMVSYGG